MPLTSEGLHALITGQLSRPEAGAVDQHVTAGGQLGVSEGGHPAPLHPASASIKQGQEVGQ